MRFATTTRLIGQIVAAASLGLALLACYAPATPALPQATSLPSAQPEPPTAMPAPQDNEPSTPLAVALAMDKAPRVGEEAQVILEVKAYVDAPGTTARIELPAEAALVSGELEWTGDVSVGQPVQLAATIVFAREGVYSVRGSALRPVDEGMTWGDAEDIFLTIGQDGSFFGLEDGGTQLSASPEPAPGN